MAVASGGEKNQHSPSPSTNIQSIPPSTAFQPKNVPPVQYIYVRAPEQLVVVLATNATGQQVQVTYRYLTPENEIKEGKIVTIPLTAGGVLTLPIPVTESWILSISLQCLVSVANGQWTFAQVQLARSPNFTSLDYGLIWEGYIPLNTATGWPGIASKEITDGPGVLRSIVGSIPGVGVEISETVPAFRNWNLIAFHVALNTSVTVANRTPNVLIDDGVNLLLNSGSGFSQTASLSIDYYYAGGMFRGDNLNGSVGITAPNLIPLKAGYRIRTSTLNIQANDQWQAPKYLVREWGAWDA